MVQDLTNVGGQRVLVTGAAGNLGRAVVQAFLQRNAEVVAVDLSQDGLVRAFGQATSRLTLLPVNLLDEESAAAQLHKAGNIDVLCNIAGGFAMGPKVHETPAADWVRMFDLNVRTMLCTTRQFVPGMVERGRGKVINVGALSSQTGQAGMGPYGVAKSAVLRISESMAAELRPLGINVNCILPSTFDTPQNRADMPDVDPRQWVTTSDAAEVIAFLASDAARTLHGVAVPLKGAA